MESISNESKIHFYEFMEIQILHQYIQSGIGYLINALMASDRFVHLRYFSQQISSGLSLLKDLYYLVKHKGLFAQNFYELERVSEISTEHGKLSKKQILISLMLWHILPYVCRKIQRKFNQIKEELDAGQQNAGFFKKVFAAIFPYIYMLINAVQTVMKFNKFYNLQYFFSKTTVDYKQTDQQYQYPLFTLMKSPGLLMILMAHKIASLVFNRKKDRASHRKINKEIKPPSKTDKNEERVFSKKGECPICGKKIKNSAMLKQSGYVFCYSCIFQFIKKYKYCPISKVPADEESVQLLYD